MEVKHSLMNTKVKVKREVKPKLSTKMRNLEGKNQLKMLMMRLMKMQNLMHWIQKSMRSWHLKCPKKNL